MFTTEKSALMYLYMTFVLSKRDTRPRALSNRYNPSLFCLDIVVYFEYESELTSKKMIRCICTFGNEQVTLVSKGGSTLLQLNSVLYLVFNGCTTIHRAHTKVYHLFKVTCYILLRLPPSNYNISYALMDLA